MRREYFTALGIALFAILVGIVTNLGVPEVNSTTFFVTMALLVAADLFVLGGLTEEITAEPYTVRWYHLVGAGAVLLGGTNVLFSVARMFQTGVAVVSGVSFAILGVAIVFIGIDLARGGTVLDISKIQSA